MELLLDVDDGSQVSAHPDVLWYYASLSSALSVEESPVAVSRHADSLLLVIHQAVDTQQIPLQLSLLEFEYVWSALRTNAFGKYSPLEFVAQWSAAFSNPAEESEGS